MTTVSAVHFLFLLLIVGTLIRLVEVHYPDTPVGRALSFIY